MSKTSVRFFVIQTLLIAALSLVSNYSIPDLSKSNWQTVLFLTPSGIVENYLSESPVMRSFYPEISEGQVTMETAQRVLMVLIYLGLLGNSGIFIFDLRRRQRLE